MSGSAPPPAPPQRGRESSPPFNSDEMTPSYSYDSYDSYSSSSSYSDSDSSSGSHRPRHRGRIRSRSRSPVYQQDAHAAVHKKVRSDAVLGNGDGELYPAQAAYASHQPYLPPPPVLGDAVLADLPVGAYSSNQGSVLGTPDRPHGDWACGVCSNINSQQRAECFRCGCHFTESLLVMPSYEVCVTQLPPGCSFEAVEEALRRTSAANTLTHVTCDGTKGIVYAQFASVEDATKYLVGRRCQLDVSPSAVSTGLPVSTRVCFSLSPHPRPTESAESAQEAARAAAAAAAQKQEAELSTAGVPRFLWPHTWNPPTGFPSAEKHKAFLSTMSAHWDHLSDAQKKYYEGEVKKALLKSVTAPEATSSTGATSATSNSPATAAVAATTTTANGPSTASGAAAATESPQKNAGKTSNALDGLKKRLAERKSALKKSDAAGGLAVGTATAGSPGGLAASASVAKTGGTPGAAAHSGGSDFPSSPSCAAPQMLLWSGFPVPPQYTSLQAVPHAIELPRVPMSVCERLLPPALLQVARMQVRK